MTRKRLFIVASLIAVLIGIGMGAAALITDGPGITKAKFDRIEMGMAKAEVEEILGEKGKWIGEGLGKFAYWKVNDQEWVGIDFVDDRLIQMEWHDSPETVLDKIRRWLHLP